MHPLVWEDLQIHKKGLLFHFCTVLSWEQTHDCRNGSTVRPTHPRSMCDDHGLVIGDNSFLENLTHLEFVDPI